MKKIYKIGIRQDFTYTTFGFFKKNIEEHWVIRNVKYIYANSREEAEEKYERWFFYEPKSIIRGWSDWYSESAGINIMMEENRINITSTNIVSIDEEIDINVDYETLRKNMQAENFKEWWFNEKIII